MKSRILAGLLCTMLLFCSGASVMASSDIEANAQANNAAKAKIEKIESEASISMVSDDVDANEAVSVDPVEDGSSSTGICTIIYRDGANGEVFDDRSIEVHKGESTPLYTLPEDIRPGYEFVSWSPALSQKVTDSQVYVAQWKAMDDAIDVVSDNAGGVKEDAENVEDDVNTVSANVSANKGTSQNVRDASLSNNGKEDAYADDVDSGDIPVGLLVVGLGVSVFALIGMLLLFRKTNKQN